MSSIGYILLVDDSENDRELTRNVLAEHKLANDIIEARDGVEALEFLHCRGPFSSRDPINPALILLDINMPRVSGLELLRTIRADPKLCQIPVVMLTSSREELDVDDCSGLKANAYVVKPVEFEDFVEAIKAIGKFWGVLNEMPRTGN